MLHVAIHNRLGCPTRDAAQSTQQRGLCLLCATRSSDGKISSVRYLPPSAHPCRGSEKTVHVLALTRASVLAGASMYLCADERITHAETETIQNVNVVTSGPMLIQCLTTQ